MMGLLVRAGSDEKEISFKPKPSPFTATKAEASLSKVGGKTGFQDFARNASRGKKHPSLR
jgi:hypothetical protein